ncbi:hypothetical protein GCM10009860_25290 [Microbacterium mitrae]|uniref:Peptidyl-prolyl cis-trans isomerase n=1 Tax=Microbacterium mitrae TaxID=664640 RepID=A0A5C8HLV2_9MICO|nr:peptidylprolyl isomerase [Microbacterium mitrae]TXK02723.1 peptidylprolyl isomerase [Microbacterium mitrae]
MRLLASTAATALLALTLLGCASTPSNSGSTSGGTDASDSATTSTTEPAASGTCDYFADGSASAKDGTQVPPAEPAVTGEVTATMKTSVGDLVLTLDADAAPCAVNSFVSLAEQGYYDDTSCHRLTTQGIYILQCGDPTATGMGGPGYSFADELTGTEKYEAGTLAMANAGPNTNGSQFFFVYESAPGALAPSYTSFGSFDEASLATLRDVAATGVAADGVTPVTAVDIETITISR